LEPAPLANQLDHHPFARLCSLGEHFSFKRYIFTLKSELPLLSPLPIFRVGTAQQFQSLQQPIAHLSF
jgi:hypothetical protein